MTTPVAEKLGNSEYLIRYYVEAAQALRYFEESEDHGNSTAAREALNKAAALICEALSRLSEDQHFWDSLATLREPIEKNLQIIRQTLDDIDLFIAKEEAVLLEYKLPPAIVRRLLSDLTLTLKVFRIDLDAKHITALRSGIRDAREAICAMSIKPVDDEPRHQFFHVASATRETLGILGGAVTIVIDGIGSAAHPLALASILGGASSSLVFLEWLRRRKDKAG